MKGFIDEKGGEEHKSVLQKIERQHAIEAIGPTQIRHRGIRHLAKGKQLALLEAHHEDVEGKHDVDVQKKRPHVLTKQSHGGSDEKSLQSPLLFIDYRGREDEKGAQKKIGDFPNAKGARKRELNERLHAKDHECGQRPIGETSDE